MTDLLLGAEKPSNETIDNIQQEANNSFPPPINPFYAEMINWLNETKSNPYTHDTPHSIISFFVWNSRPPMPHITWIIRIEVYDKETQATTRSDGYIITAADEEMILTTNTEQHTTSDVFVACKVQMRISSLFELKTTINKFSTEAKLDPLSFMFRMPSKAISDSATTSTQTKQTFQPNEPLEAELSRLALTPPCHFQARKANTWNMEFVLRSTQLINTTGAILFHGRDATMWTTTEIQEEETPYWIIYRRRYFSEATAENLIEFLQTNNWQSIDDSVIAAASASDAVRCNPGIPYVKP